jgi:hypothetical protein
MKRGVRTLLFIVQIVFGLYFVNVAFNWVEVISPVTEIGKWITFVGGLFILFGAINFMKVTKYNVTR